MNAVNPVEAERLRRWRLALGAEGATKGGPSLSKQDAGMDRALQALYGQAGGQSGRPSGRGAGLGDSMPSVPRWLGDIRGYFPTSVVQVMQRDALDRLGLREMLMEPEMLEAVEPDVNLVGTLISLRKTMGERVKDTARQVVRKVTDDLIRRLEDPMRQAIAGSVDRTSRTRRPRHADIDWNRTIRANLRHYQPELGTIVPERLVGYGRRARMNPREVILLVDQSGSMANSVVYSSVFGAVMASVPAVRTSLVVFDTNVVDLTDQLSDPVDVLFSVQLGGGTEIDRAVRYGEGLVRRPEDTTMVLISDLEENGLGGRLPQTVARILGSGVRLIVLLALSDEGAPHYDARMAARLSNLGAPAFACTPDLFPGMMAAALGGRDVAAWAAGAGIKVAA